MPMQRQLGHYLVSAYLNCRHTTGKTERWLKDLAEQADPRPNLSKDPDAKTLSDILQVQAHAPRPNEVTYLEDKRIVTKGTYCDQLLQTYGKCFKA